MDENIHSHTQVPFAVCPKLPFDFDPYGTFGRGIHSFIVLQHPLSDIYFSFKTPDASVALVGGADRQSDYDVTKGRFPEQPVLAELFMPVFHIMGPFKVKVKRPGEIKDEGHQLGATRGSVGVRPSPTTSGLCGSDEEGRAAD